jgi:putative methionine-R-sulfoxide reductase with GAF domain
MEIFHIKVAELLVSQMPRAEKANVLASLIQSERTFHWVGLYDVSAPHISAVAWTGSEPLAFPIVPVTKGINGAAVAQRVPVVVQDVFTDSCYLTTFGASRSEVISPVLTADMARVVGTIEVESDRVNAFQADGQAF